MTFGGIICQKTELFSCISDYNAIIYIVLFVAGVKEYSTLCR
jgi:hypothetical protein